MKRTLLPSHIATLGLPPCAAKADATHLRHHAAEVQAVAGGDHAVHDLGGGGSRQKRCTPRSGADNTDNIHWMHVTTGVEPWPDDGLNRPDTSRPNSTSMCVEHHALTCSGRARWQPDKAALSLIYPRQSRTPGSPLSSLCQMSFLPPRVCCEMPILFEVKHRQGSGTRCLVHLLGLHARGCVCLVRMRT